jgi:hypothetical protein
MVITSLCIDSASAKPPAFSIFPEGLVIPWGVLEPLER